MAKRLLVVGGGAREHALLWKLAQSPGVGQLLAAPGNAGTAELSENIPVAANDIDGLVRTANERSVDLVVVGPEEPLALGLADRLTEAGIPVFGPSQAASKIESSKAWAKDVMRAAGVPTAQAVVVESVVDGIAALSTFGLPVVIKADGLAAGKGVVVATTHLEAKATLEAFLTDGSLGAAGASVLIEEWLDGQEVSVLGISDGVTVLPLTPARDHKRAFDGDAGPNTGGMGAVSPISQLGESELDQIRRTILEPVVAEMARRGAPMKGVLYAGLMLTADGPRVLEFNARFGDPETQVVVPFADVDILELFEAAITGTLADFIPPRPPIRTAVGVVLASGGYPGSYPIGAPIIGIESVPDDVLVFHAGTRRDPEGGLETNGGRVLTVVGLGDDVKEAQQRAYAGAKAITFDGAHYRKDIGGYFPPADA